MRRVIDRLEARLNPTHTVWFETGPTLVRNADDPLAEFLTVEHQTLVVNVAAGDLRWSRLGLRLGGHTAFEQTVRCQRDGTCTTYSGSPLERHFSNWAPDNAAVALGLDPATAGAIATQPSQALTLPWLAEACEVDPARRLERLERWTVEETRPFGRALGRGHGHKHFGPVSSQFGEVEFERYAALTRSISQQGFVAQPVGDTFVGVQLLVDGDAVVALALGPGLHRALVAVALGVDPLPVAVDRPPRVVHRVDARRWRGVRSGLFDQAAALALFDRIMEGTPPHGMPTGEL